MVADTNQANPFNPKDTVDYLSTSFAATEMMISFWHKQGFKAVHMGLKRDASSGCHSVIMLKPLSNKGRLLLATAQQQFYWHFPALLTEALQDVEQAIIAALLVDRPHVDKEDAENNELSVVDKADLHSFAYGHRGYAFCLYAIRKLLRLPSVQTLYLVTLSQQQQRLLQQRVINELPIATVVETLRLSGKKALDKQLRCAIKGVLEQDYDYFFTG
jgi:tRNA(Met) cytidine acetyltransferase